MKAGKRKILLATSLVLTLAATAYFRVNDEIAAGEPEVVAAVEVAKTRDSHPNTSKPLMGILVQRELQDPAQDIFAVVKKVAEPEVKNAAPPPPTLPPPVVIAPPVPTAPPIPFNYIGKLSEDGITIVFLGLRGNNLAVKAGDVIQQTYRIDEIKPPLLTMTYLPMNIKQSIQIGEPN